MEFVLIAVAILVVALITGISLLVGRGRRTARLEDDAAAGTTLTRPRPAEPRPQPRPEPSAPVDQPPPPAPGAVGPGRPPRRRPAGGPACGRAAPRRAGAGADVRDPAALG